MKTASRIFVLSLFSTIVFTGCFASTLVMETRKGNASAVMKALQSGEDVNTQKYEQGYPGWTALMFASYSGDLAIVKILLNAKADPNIQAKDGWTALMSACASTKNNSKPEILAEIARLLLAAGADVNAKADNKSTALLFACYAANESIVAQLIDAKADVNVKSDSGYTAVINAVIKCNDNILKQLLDSHADILSKTMYGTTAFQYAYSNNFSFNCAKMLVKAGADVNEPEKKGGMTPLMKVVTYPDANELIAMMIEHKVDVNAKENNLYGSTALMYAIVFGHPEYVNQLVQAGADMEYARQHFKKENQSVRMKCG